MSHNPMNHNRATILIADDHDLLRDMLARRLGEEPDLQVIGVVADASAALEQALEHRPDLVLMDIDMPGLSAFEAARLIRDRLPDTRVLFVSAYVRDGFISQALEVRAWGYLTKGQNPEELVGCIRTVIGGGSCFSPEVESRLEIGPDGVGLTQKRRSRLELLTARERQILSYLARGLSKKEIARLDGTSVKTIDHHCQHVMEKLDLHDRVELTRFAIREGLVTLGKFRPLPGYGEFAPFPDKPFRPKNVVSLDSPELRAVRGRGSGTTGFTSEAKR